MLAGTGLGLRQRKYAVLLVLLCVAIAIESVSSRGADQFVSDAVRTLLVVAIWIVVFTRPRERVAMAALLVAGLALRWGGYLAVASLDHALSLADQTIAAVFLCSAVYVILRDLFRTPAGSAENVLGAICG